MSVLDEVTAEVETARGGIDSSNDAVRAVINEAGEKADQLESLGLDAAASTLRAAQSDLEAASASLVNASESVTGVVGALGQIATPVSAKQSAERLASIVSMFDSVAGALETAVESTRQAYQRAEAAEVDRVTGAIAKLFEGLSSIRQGVTEAKKRVDEYRQQIEAASQGN